MQGELLETVRALDEGIKAADEEMQQATAAAEQLVQVQLTLRPSATVGTRPKAPGSLRNSPVMMRLQSQAAEPPKVSPIAVPHVPFRASKSAAGATPRPPPPPPPPG